MLRTAFTNLLNLSCPLLSAPMSNHSGGRLAAAVSQAGGLGCFGGSHNFGPAWLGEQIAYVRAQTDQPFGVGFITPLLAADPQNFDRALAERVPVILLSFSDPQPWLGRAKAAGAIVLCQVQSWELAQAAVDAGADGLIAQGNAAGGHTGTMNLLPLLNGLLARYPELPILAAGGLATGRDLAAALAMGAAGASVGTAFLATPEAVEVPAAFKERIILSDGQDTAYTPFYDLLDDAPWPPGIAGRVYRNRLVREWAGREREVSARRTELAAAVAAARAGPDPEVAAVYMGQSAARVNAIRPAAAVVAAICREAEVMLRGRAYA